MSGTASTAQLSQKEYANRVGVDPSRISRATNEGGVVRGKYVPARDAVTDETGNLLGYQMPVERDVSPGDVSVESAQKAAGVSSNGSSPSAHGMENGENVQPRENPSGPSRSTRSSQSSGQSRDGSGLEQALENAGDVAGREVARRPGALRGLLRIAGSAAGAILAAELVGRGAGPVLLGTAIGFAITEYAIQAEETEPQKPTRQIRPTGLRRPVTYNLPPGMNQVDNQRPSRSQTMVEKERLARSRPAGT